MILAPITESKFSVFCRPSIRAPTRRGLRKSAARHNTFRCYPTHRVGGEVADHQLPAAQVRLAKTNESHFDAAEWKDRFGGRHCLAGGNNRSPAAMIASGPRARARRPKRCSHRNDRPAIRLFRNRRRQASHRCANRGNWQLCRRRRRSVTKSQRQPVPERGSRQSPKSRCRKLPVSAPGRNMA